jgi:2-polyprenyl-3-methyl-5-hydroxy-6-metoxy-1,4-benzoquinol methylase
MSERTSERSPGQFARRLLGPQLFKPLGDAYRAFFVDLNAVAASFPQLSRRASILEVGGGDGQLMNALLARFQEAHATMIDISPRLGDALDKALLARVQLLPNTSIKQYIERGHPPPDLISVCDVVHHVPLDQRVRFFADLRPLIGPDTLLVVKDIRPGTPRAYLSYLADRYVSGDRTVSLLDEAELEALVKSAIPGVQAERTSLYDHDAPNYAIVFRR